MIVKRIVFTIKQCFQPQHLFLSLRHYIEGYPDCYQYLLHLTCPRPTMKIVQDKLAEPVIGQEEIILRYMFFKQ